MSHTMHLTPRFIAENPDLTTVAAPTTERDRRDGGWTLIELMLVVLILGVLATAVIFAVSAMRAEAADSSCGMDRRILANATESYFAETRSSTVPATGTGHDRFEQTLVDGEYLRDVSTYYDLDATGAATPEGDSPC